MSNATTTGREAQIVADPDIPVITITREFDHPPAKVYRAWAEPELVKQWMGPRSVDMDIERWDCSTGGGYRYTATRDGEELAHFYGCFHQAVPGERLVQTFGFEEMPEAVSLEIMEFEPLDDGTRCRIVSRSIMESMEAQAGMMASGMEVGVQEGYDKLDELLAAEGAA
ncbi:SRPBCC family protein [Luteipulveratus halotolerans]|uniref:Polyketide cyclase n=1 Tax=Luteipulveratus halotolerans TaxID=1631356 RepID=A0A0L6CFB1_9MICO|nr:SRPBCC family protein [Luteipulveratus halotolerans]KNX36213.1 polyketide cyclase [Luteipulveratus halotolerans]